MHLTCCSGPWSGLPAPVPAGSVHRPADRLPDRIIQSATWCCRLVRRLVQFLCFNFITTLVYMWYLFGLTFSDDMYTYPTAIFLICLFLGGRFLKLAPLFKRDLYYIGLCLSKKFLMRFSSNTYLYILFRKPFASSYSNHCCAWLCD